MAFLRNCILFSLIVHIFLTSHCWGQEQGSEISIKADAVALNYWGESYHFGERDVPQDLTKARGFYLEAVKLGSAPAANHLGRIYLMGEGVKKDKELAETWYKKSVQLDPSIENKCINGQCADKILCELIFAANSPCSSSDTDYAVALLYDNGHKEIPADFKKAFKFYKKAALKGHRSAVKHIIDAYRNGHGAVQDENKAHAWEIIAVDL